MEVELDPPVIIFRPLFLPLDLSLSFSHDQRQPPTKPHAFSHPTQRRPAKPPRLSSPSSTRLPLLPPRPANGVPAPPRVSTPAISNPTLSAPPIGRGNLSPTISQHRKLHFAKHSKSILSVICRSPMTRAVNSVACPAFVFSRQLEAATCLFYDIHHTGATVIEETTIGSSTRTVYNWVDNKGFV
ncbi:uncharacterized protein LOC144557199 [Carex rostrata]